MFQHFHEEGLSQSSYPIACARTRQAAIVDPASILLRQRLHSITSVADGMADLQITAGHR
jgi:hypothetical protein